MVPDIYVICLESKFAERGAATLTFLANNIDKHLYGTLKKFTAVTPSDFIIEDTASARQVAIIRGRKRRVEQGDMSKHAQVACALSHISLWQLSLLKTMYTHLTCQSDLKRLLSLTVTSF